MCVFTTAVTSPCATFSWLSWHPGFYTKKRKFIPFISKRCLIIKDQCHRMSVCMSEPLKFDFLLGSLQSRSSFSLPLIRLVFANDDTCEVWDALRMPWESGKQLFHFFHYFPVVSNFYLAGYIANCDECLIPQMNVLSVDLDIAFFAAEAYTWSVALRYLRIWSVIRRHLFYRFCLSGGSLEEEPLEYYFL